jgi:methionyl aminopeptidase
VNDEVVHGLPSDARVIKKGDIVSVDFGVTYRGMVTDAARSLLVQSNDAQKQKLIRATLQSLEAGIATLKDGVKTGTIGAAIEAVLGDNSLGIVRDFVGHGVGHHMHEEPNIPNYGRPNTGDSLYAGMTIAIEPMATLGGDGVYIDADGWTVKTNDGSLSAHFEDTVLILDDGYEVLTRTS